MRTIGLLAVVGCASPSVIPVVVDGEVNAAPELLAASIGCDDFGGSLGWTLEAEVTDPDGAADIYEVHVTIYDEVTGEPVDDIGLLRMADGVWAHRLDAAETGLDCAYGRYSADFLVLDEGGASDGLTAVPGPADE